MATISIGGDTSGTVTLAVPAVAGTNTISLPALTGTAVLDNATQTLTSKTLTSPVITGASISSMASSVLTSGTVQNTTSGTSIDFTGIPSWVKRITVMLNGVSTNGTSLLQIQLGSGTIATTGYLTYAWTNNTVSTAATSGFVLSGSGGATNTFYGFVQFVNVSANLWVASGTFNSGANVTVVGGGSNTAITSTLDRLRLTTVSGIDTFDAGSINILYE